MAVDGTDQRALQYEQTLVSVVLFLSSVLVPDTEISLISQTLIWVISSLLL